ncbi:TVP38/TMEM64 family protein [Alkalicoccus chagannorensis]|uniref:TVP38/TMEM64 family protein n=1 Tax=Alkalicoccus chagannorensis TaxID=427072 RepID=UPI00042A2FF8|nr:VTT domain-containing protein [Alkalicoccus chagannorensis]
MEGWQDSVMRAIEYTGWAAPLLFILLHLLRPLLFLPVVVVCMAGGYFFGFVQGTLYSIAGLSLMSAVFYGVVNHFPSFRRRIRKLKKNVFQDKSMSIGQVMILRMLPFIHFHLLSLYIMEMTPNFYRYMIVSTAGIVLPSMMFTGLGHMIVDLSWPVSAAILAVLGVVFYLLGRSEQRGRTMQRQA